MTPGFKRQRDGGGGGRDGHHGSRAAKRARGDRAGRPPATVGGPGIFVTTTRGRERKAALQLVDVLEEHAAKLYPDVKLEPFVHTHAAGGVGTESGTSSNSSSRRKVKAEQEEDEDALWNGGGEADDDKDDDDGKTSNPPAANPNPNPNPTSDPLPQETVTQAKDAPEDDIQAQIRAELAELGAVTRASASKAHDDSKPPRFVLVTQNLMDCVAFVRITPPQDPHKLTYSVLEEAEQTGGARCRYLQRLSPVTDTCPANFGAIAELARRVLSAHFTSDRPRTYRIEPRVRANNVIKRDPLIKEVGNQVPAGHGHTVNLKEPELVIVVEILKNVCGIGVAEHWNRFKRFNPAMIAEEVQKQRTGAAEGGEAGTDGAAVVERAEGRVAASTKR